jgi:uncharacterized protein (TIGR02611 family)
MTRRGHDMIIRLRERQTRHRDRGIVFRVAFAVAGFLVILGGILLLVLPGPGLLVIAIGLGMLALEFVWAERLLERAIDWAEAAREKAENRSRGEKIASGVAIAIGLTGFAVAAILWDIPVLPV